MPSDRLACLPRQPLLPPLHDLDARRAATPLARLRGLAALPPDAIAPRTALLLPRTRSVHTAGMRFPLDLVWLDRAGRVVRVDLAVGPWRLRSCRRAVEVLELPAGSALAARLRPGATLA
jgi:uncharacterized membrane protein (UPF0127 family)